MSFVDVLLVGGPGDGMIKRMRGWQSSALPKVLLFPIEPPLPSFRASYQEVFFRVATYDRCDCTQDPRAEAVYRWRVDK